MTDQTGCSGIVRHEGEVEADELVVGLGELEGLLARTDLGGDAVQLVVEDVAQPLGEDQRQDVVLVFGSILGAANGAGGVPDPGFEGFGVGVRRRHGGPFSTRREHSEGLEERWGQYT